MANSGRLVTDDGVMSEIARRSVLDLKRLDPALEPEVGDWLCAVRPIWAAAGVSMTEFTADAPIDKSTEGYRKLTRAGFRGSQSNR
jgi:hypothetical protein